MDIKKKLNKLTKKMAHKNPNEIMGVVRAYVDRERKKKSPVVETEDLS